MKYLLFIPFFLCSLNSLAQSQAKTEALPALGIDPSSVTVSGISSGAFMAVQLGIAYSQTFYGVAAIAGGVYGCSEGSANTAKEICMKDPVKIDIQKPVSLVQQNFTAGLIDDPQYLRRQKIYILHGTEDKIVLPVASRKLVEFYQALQVQPRTEFSLQMGHGFPAEKGTNACQISRFPWMNRCNYDGAGSILEYFYGPLHTPAKKLEALTEFDQNEFNGKEARLMDHGHVYIPQVCKEPGAKCRLHLALHGCMQSPSIAGKAFTEGAGFNEWAESNRVVVLYPATFISDGNPNGCWDWFGYSGADFTNKKSLQMKALISMIQRLSEN